MVATYEFHELIDRKRFQSHSRKLVGRVINIINNTKIRDCDPSRYRDRSRSRNRNRKLFLVQESKYHFL